MGYSQCQLGFLPSTVCLEDFPFPKHHFGYQHIESPRILHWVVPPLPVVIRDPPFPPAGTGIHPN